MTLEPIVEEEEEEAVVEDEKPPCENQLKIEAMTSRKEKRKAMKKSKRKQLRKEIALKEREEEEAMLNDPQEQARRTLLEQKEAERIERDRKEFEERERAWLEALEMKKKKEAEEREEEDRRKAVEDSNKLQVENENECEDDEDWEYVEEGPPEIIWQGNEIIFKKKRVRVPKKNSRKEDDSRPTSNPLPPQSEAYADYNNASRVSAQQLLENVAQQVPNFGTELDKAHCPFHLKTGACRFGQRCSRAHFYPDKSCTLLIKNMYSGPGITWEQDEGLEVCKRCLHVVLKLISRFILMEAHGSALVGMDYGVKDSSISHTDEEVECCYEEFYEDVHTEFLKFGEIVNFKVCRNGSVHLRGNVYIHYKSLDSAVQAYQSINGRYFAGKQVSCEFVNVTKWKVAICGEYMKSRFKTCSHGTACNFIHCFRNPGGDYEWADWDKPPPRYWIKKMVALFGYYDESGYEKQTEQEHLGQTKSSNKTMTMDADRHYSKRSRYREMDRSNNVPSGGRWNDAQTSNVVQSDDRERIKVIDRSMSRNNDTDSDGDWSDRDRDRNRKKSRHHTHSRESSRRRRQEESRSPINDGYSKKATHKSDSNEDWSDRDEDREARHGHARKGSGRRSRIRHTDSDTHLDSNGRSKASRSPDKKITRESDSGGDWSDRKTHHSHTRKSSRKRSKGHPDDDGNRRKRRRTEWDQLIKDKETHHSRGGESSRHQSKERYEGHYEDRKKRSRSTDLSKE